MKKLFALLLALAMVLSLAACGKNSDSPSKPNATETPAFVYAAEYKDLVIGKYPDATTINPNCYTEDGFYSLVNEKISDEVPEDGTATSYKGQTGTFEYRLYFIGYDGQITRLENYEPLDVAGNPEGYADFSANNYIDTVEVGEDGKLYVIENLFTRYYDGPEGLGTDSDEYWDYYNYTDEYYFRVLDTDGTPLSSAKIDLPEETYLYSYMSIPDQAGNLLVGSDQALLAISPEGTIAYRISLDGWADNALRLPDGRAAVTVSGEKGIELRFLDLESKSLGEAVELPQDAWNLIPGSGDYDLYYTSGVSIYGLKLGGEPELIVNLLNCDVDSSSMSTPAVLSDGTVVGVISNWDSSYEHLTTELMTLKMVPSDTVPQKINLSMAVNYLDYSLRRQVIDFNRKNEQYHINVTDYSQYNVDDGTEEGSQAGVTKLLTEIMAGNVPDILSLSNLPYTQLAAKGLLEDLYPFIDSDPELSREDFFPNVLSALEVDGHLCQAVSNFYLISAIGARSVVGDTPGWTFEEFDRALASMPEGCTPFEYYVTKDDMLRTCLDMDMDSYVDWTTGKCSFDSPAFISLLKFCNRFLDEFDWNNYEYDAEDDTKNRVAQGQQMLMQANIYSLDELFYNDFYFGGDGSSSAITYIGYPTNNGVGNALGLPYGYAMSSRCADKEGAWAFLRSFLTQEYQEDNGWYLPTNRKVFEEQLKAAMTVEYETDENGNQVLDENGEPVPRSKATNWLEDGSTQEVYALTQEQADMIRELAETTTKVSESNASILKIVSEDAGEFFRGNKTAEETAKLIQSKVNIHVNEQR